MSANGVKNEDGSFQTDENRLVLHCDQKVVGTCHFDLADYADKGPIELTAAI